MSRLSGVNQGTLEQLLSTDLNIIQRGLSRDVLNVLRGLLGRNTPLVGGSAFRSGVIDGLRVTIDQALGPPRVIVGSGRCTAFDATTVETDATLDSLYLLAEQTNTTTETLSLAAPVPGIDRLDLIEAVPAYDTITNESRNFYDPATGALTPALTPKRQRPGINYVVTSTTAPAGTLPFMAAFTAGRVPIAAALVTAAGGAVRVYDLRRFVTAGNGDLHGTLSGVGLWSGIKGVATTVVAVGPFEGYVDGVRVRQSAHKTYAVTTAMDEGAGFLNNDFVYLYLALPDGASFYDPNIDAMTQLIVSRQLPGADGRPLANFVGGVRPLSNTLIGRSALYIGAAFLEDAATGRLRPFYRSDDGWTRHALPATEEIDFATPLPATTTVDLSAHPVTGLPLVPATADAVRATFLLQNGVAPPVGIDQEYDFAPGAAAAPAGTRWVRIINQLEPGAFVTFQFEIPVHTRQFHITRVPPSDPGAAERIAIIAYHEAQRRIL